MPQLIHGASPQPLAILASCLLGGINAAELEAGARAKLLDPKTDHLRLARLAGRHLVLTMLAPALSAYGVDDPLPADFRSYLQFMHDRNKLRNQALRKQVLQIAALLNQIDIEPVLLKGAVRLVDRLYPDLGWRFMQDLDILVPAKRLDEVNVFLRAQGFEPTRPDEDWPAEHRHLPPLYRNNDAAVIEVHGKLLRHELAHCPTDRVLERAQPFVIDNAVVRLPTCDDQIASLIGHDQFDDHQRRSGLFVLRNLFELALLGREAGGFEAVRPRSARGSFARFANRRISMAASLFPTLVDELPSGGLAVDLWKRALLGVERLDGEGRVRRFVGFSRTRAAKLLRSPADRRHLSANLLAPAYHRRSFRRLKQLWTGL